MARISLPGTGSPTGMLNAARLLRELDADPEDALTEVFEGFMRPEMRDVLRSVALNQESLTRTLRRLIQDDLDRCQGGDLRCRRLLAFRPKLGLPGGTGKPYRMQANLTEEQFRRANLRKDALACTRGDYMDMLILRAQVLQERGIIVPEDPLDVQRDHRVFARNSG